MHIPRLPRALVSLVVPALVAGAPGCLRRDVAAEQPTTKLSFDTVIPQPAIDKVDVLVMVDNSSSMADKQRILARALPDLVRGLVQPACVDVTTRAPTGTLTDPQARPEARCPAGSEPAFEPITDMHLGVISSSLGGLGGRVCGDSGDRHNDDRGHLLARGPAGDVAAAGELHFLAWYPDVEQNQDKLRHPEPPVPKTRSVADLGDAFRALVVGAGQDGCGLEAQLESVYRFLVQPDPWTRIAVDGPRASYGRDGDVDMELLRQRAAFLRPDSLVAVIVLTDEDDSSVDPLALGGSGFQFANEAPMPRATEACERDPAGAACTSCAFQPDASCVAKGAAYSAAEDPMNLRFYRMKQRFGVDPQYPIQRYVDGFTKPKVPGRAKEHDAAGRYAPSPDCTNPLFAARLPSAPTEERCKLPRGPRTPDLVYFALIGGVPNELLRSDDGKLDWTRLLGRDPSRWDESGIDPHMSPSVAPRVGLPGPGAADDADPVHGREWTTAGKDLQYACTFALFDQAGDGSIVPVQRACDPESRRLGICDCDGVKDAPLCASADRSVQVRGKAYPTRRELMVAKELGDHAIVASLCPRQLTEPERDDYGYRPAIRAIGARLARSLTASCLPRALERDESGSVACVVMAILPEPGPASDCQTRYGLASAPAERAEPLRDRLAGEEGESVRALPVCDIPQLAGTPTCRAEESATGFCYVEGDPAASTCRFGLAFSRPAGRLAGARFTMQCIQTSGAEPTPVSPGN
jgi:hypothetical protein